MRSNLIDFSSTLPRRIAVVSVVVENFDDAGNLRRSFRRAYMSCLAKELLMQTRRFGRKMKLPATMAIKHQIRMLMAQYEDKKTEAAEAGAEGAPGHPSPAVLSAVPATEITLRR
jgi:hypothetical protein